jgi:hypothetical protein
MQRKERQYPSIFMGCFHGYVLKLLFFAVRIALCVKCLEREKEQVTVEKQSVVREEIGLGKRQVQETQQVTDTVRKEEVEIERAYNQIVQDGE